jgi:CPA2 family monovalent cation:H+ antiporter-2
VLVGYGRVGRKLAEALTAEGVPFVVADQNREVVERLRAAGIPAVFGDAAQPEVLVQSHVARARLLVIATPDALGVRQMSANARLLNPRIEIVVRSHNEEEARRLEDEIAGRVFVGEHELALAMTRHVLARCQVPIHV